MYDLLSLFQCVVAKLFVNGYLDLTLSISVIKHKLNCFLWNHFIENFDVNNHCTFYFFCPCNHCIQLPHHCNFNPL